MQITRRTVSRCSLLNRMVQRPALNGNNLSLQSKIYSALGKYVMNIILVMLMILSMVNMQDKNC